MNARRTPGAARGAVAFTDLVGFTEFTAARGDEDALALLHRHDDLLRSCLPDDARKVKDLGDGFLLWFPDACAAVESMLRLQQGLDTSGVESDWPLWIRVGVHWGSALRRGDDLVGHDVNVAARIVDVAGPGEVLVSDATVGEVGERLAAIAFTEIGPVTMKGIPEPVRLFRAGWRADRLA